MLQACDNTFFSMRFSGIDYVIQGLMPELSALKCAMAEPLAKLNSFPMMSDWGM